MKKGAYELWCLAILPRTLVLPRIIPVYSQTPSCLFSPLCNDALRAFAQFLEVLGTYELSDLSFAERMHQEP